MQLNFTRTFLDKEKESRAKFESVKMQIKLIADYGRYLLEIGVSDLSLSQYVPYSLNVLV
jgi:hypothetical protein